MERNRPVRKKPTLAPAQCAHCHTIWYGSLCRGHEGGLIAVLDDIVLCTRCWSALDTHLYRVFPTLYDSLKTRDEAHASPAFYKEASRWIADEAQKPYPAKKLYQRSVPLWMRLAMEKGWVEPNGYDVYTVTVQDGEPIHVEKTHKGGIHVLPSR